ncbi:hypothetical protein DLJ47_30095 [Micromonospora sp. S4605]|uniref:hypothetical protein n=1 Tax=Micromonospora sp. S4605 TaxID=1420897 RepID=UPI000D6F85E3|nr:hypothetical protein [Micromonospora sp. S4605]PWU47632.1 hypothetical protein DLJ47_30095 [Micromonospora sp. S4605]
MSSTVHAADGRAPLLRTVLAGQVALLAAAVVVTAMWLGRMAAAGIGPAELASGAYDPKDLVPFGLSMANPFTWLYVLVSLLFLAGLVAVPMLALYSVVLLVRDRVGMPRRTWWLLLAVTAGATAVTVLRFSPAGTELTRWWLD